LNLSWGKAEFSRSFPQFLKANTESVLGLSLGRLDIGNIVKKLQTKARDIPSSTLTKALSKALLNDYGVDLMISALSINCRAFAIN
jgi:hypothetical protein